jgi:hypothetical protein
MLAILAPVPAEILADGFNVKNLEGIVAFGTGSLDSENSGAWSFEFFSRAEIAHSKDEIPVVIYGSATDLVAKHRLHRPGYVTAVGVYHDLRAPKAGKHPRPDFRPHSALIGDTLYPLFWEVIELRELSKKEQIPLKKLKLFGSGAGKLKPHTGVAPRGPQLVVIADEFASVLQATRPLSRTTGEGGAHAKGG